MTLALSSAAIAMQAMNERNLTVTQLEPQRFRGAAVSGYRGHSSGGDESAAGGERRLTTLGALRSRR